MSLRNTRAPPFSEESLSPCTRPEMGRVALMGVGASLFVACHTCRSYSAFFQLQEYRIRSRVVVGSTGADGYSPRIFSGRLPAKTSRSVQR